MVGVPTSEISAALQKAAKLRAQVELLEPRAHKRRSRTGRVFSFVRVALTCLVLVVLGVDVGLAYEAFRSAGPAPGTSTSLAVEEPTYSDLQVFENSERFAGQIAITNPFNRDIEVFVSVALYDDEQNVGEVSGSVTLRPDSTSVVKLQGYDDFVSYTDSRVHLSGWPVSLAEPRD